MAKTTFSKAFYCRSSWCRPAFLKAKRARVRRCPAMWVATAHDGYRAGFSLPELDPPFSETRAIVADRMDGPMRLVPPSEKREPPWVRIEMFSALELVR